MILLASTADTDLLAARAAGPGLPAGFPGLRLVNPARVEPAQVPDLLDGARLAIVRLLGGRRAWPEGFAELQAECRRRSVPLVALGGEATPDAELAAASTAPAGVVAGAAAYLLAGGPVNVGSCLRFCADRLLGAGVGFDPPVELPAYGLRAGFSLPEPGPLRAGPAAAPVGPVVGVVYYRAHELSGNTGFVDELCAAITRHGGTPLPVYTTSLRPEPGGGTPVIDELLAHRVDAVITTVLAAGGAAGADAESWDARALADLDVAVIQGLCLTSSRAAWLTSSTGISPLDAAMQVAIPEFDGRLVGGPLSFKEVGADGLASYVADPERADALARTALAHARLRHIPVAQRRIGVLLSSYPTKHARVGNAVGLDTPASAVVLLRALAAAGYDLGDPAALPGDGDSLIHALIAAGGHDVEWLTQSQLAGAAARVPPAAARDWLAELDPGLAGRLVRHWGPPPGQLYVDPASGDVVVAALRFGNVVVAIQPPRGFGENPVAIYHDPDLPPSHHYLAAYRWLERDFGAHALVHLGKHGTLEWLPGKGLGLSAGCAPDAVLGGLPLVYPFIVNDPGEGTQAKRRAHATIVDHLVPPMARAESYGELAQLETLMDEHATLAALDPSKLPAVRGRIWELIRAAELHRDLGVEAPPEDFDSFLLHVDGWLCEVKDAQIRDGLHVLGQPPRGQARVHLLLAILRSRALPGGVRGLRAGLAEVFGLDERRLLDAPGEAVPAAPVVPAPPDIPAPVVPAPPDIPAPVDIPAAPDIPTQPADPTPSVAPVEAASVGATPVPMGAARTRPAGVAVSGAILIDRLESLARSMVSAMESAGWHPDAAEQVVAQHLGGAASRGAEVVRTLRFAAQELVGRLERTDEEVTHVLHALAGGFVPPGPSGSPTRGVVGVLPTGRNFYSVDPKAIPSQLAWETGSALASSLLARYLAEEGDYPTSVGLTVWGTSAMRTQGDDIAEVLALLGCRPTWDEASRRVTGFEVTPLDELGRPRVDVTVRISGFFRDAFPHVVALLDAAVRTVAGLAESDSENLVAAHARADAAECGDWRRATTRIFGSKPGAYGAGLLPLIDARTWRTDADLAEVYGVWGGYAYGEGLDGREARADMERAYRRIAVAAKNADTREHDLLDSDDYFQYHGGMVAAVRALTGSSPRAYIGDSAAPDAVRTRSLAEETARVVRSRVLNPRWVAAMRRHGYKGAFELAATVDYLFGYDATARVVEDWMYARVAERYVLDTETAAFLRASNPWALRGIAERLLEAAQRGLWADPDPATLEALRGAYLAAEAELEGGMR